jgi:hypothetical protein
MVQGILFVIRSCGSIVGIYVSYPDRANFRAVHGIVRSEASLWSEPEIEISRSPHMDYERLPSK